MHEKSEKRGNKTGKKKSQGFRQGKINQKKKRQGCGSNPGKDSIHMQAAGGKSRKEKDAVSSWVPGKTARVLKRGRMQPLQTSPAPGGGRGEPDPKNGRTVPKGPRQKRKKERTSGQSRPVQGTRPEKKQRADPGESLKGKKIHVAGSGQANPAERD